VSTISPTEGREGRKKEGKKGGGRKEAGRGRK
jgi:hypothetical protein